MKTGKIEDMPGYSAVLAAAKALLPPEQWKELSEAIALSPQDAVSHIDKLIAKVKAKKAGLEAAPSLTPEEMDVATEGFLSVFLCHPDVCEDAVLSVMSQFEPKHFLNEKHRVVFEACRKVHDQGRPLDVVQVGSLLKDQGDLDRVGGMEYLTELMNTGGNSAAAHAVAAKCDAHGRDQMALWFK